MPSGASTSSSRVSSRRSGLSATCCGTNSKNGMCGVIAAELGRRGDRDARLPAVRHHEQVALGSQLADATRLGQTPDATHVGLHHVNAAAVHEVEELEARGLPFARRDGDGGALGEPAVAVEVVDPERRLDEEHVVLGPRLDHGQRAIGVVPGVADIDHDREFRPGRGTDGSDRLDHQLVALVQALMRVRTGDQQLELGRPEAEVLGPRDLIDERAVELLPARDAGQQRRVGAEALACRIAEQLPHRLVRGLAADVPERDVERSQRVHERAAPAGHRGADVEPVPDRAPGRAGRVRSASPPGRDPSCACRGPRCRRAPPRRSGRSRRCR